MPITFPGMDPYLEGHLWPDVRLGLAFVIKEQLVPKVSPNYLVQTETYTVKDTFPEEDVGIMYPDIEILHKTKQVKEPEEAYQSSSIIIPTPPTISVSSISAIEVRIPVLEIRDQKSNQLITAIEILSPVNKRNPGLKPYRKKRIKLLESGVHLLEIDLLRRGKRPFIFPNTPKAHYWITLVRAETAKTDIWAFNIQDQLPIVPIPLKGLIKMYCSTLEPHYKHFINVAVMT